MFVSIVINADTRSGFLEDTTQQTGMFNGCRSLDFLIDGVQNKINFFDGFEKEVILFVDEHQPIPEDAIGRIRGMVDTLVIHKHSKRYADQIECHKFNDFNYVQALQLARGEYIAHFDQDCAAFKVNDSVITQMIGLVNHHYDFVCYPSDASPNPANDPTYDYFWASTRFFLCRREVLDFTEISKCLLDYEYTYTNYPASKKNHWLEHILGLISKYNNGSKVYYRVPYLASYAIFCWDH